MTIGKRIQQARQQRGVSQTALASGIGVAQTTVSSWERDRTEPGRDEVERVAIFLGMKPSELEGVGSEARMVPIVGYVGAGAIANLFAEGQGPFDEVEAPPGSHPKTVANEIRGDSLGPFFNEWLLFYDDVRTPVTQDLFGELCVVGLSDGRVLVKKLQAGVAPGLFTLLSQYEAPILDVEVEWAAKVKGMQPR